MEIRNEDLIIDELLHATKKGGRGSDRDKKLLAKRVYAEPTESWIKDPAHSDVVGIDTPPGAKPTVKNPRSKVKKGTAISQSLEKGKKKIEKKEYSNLKVKLPESKKDVKEEKKLDKLLDKNKGSDLSDYLNGNKIFSEKDLAQMDYKTRLDLAEQLIKNLDENYNSNQKKNLYSLLKLEEKENGKWARKYVNNDDDLRRHEKLLDDFIEKSRSLTDDKKRSHFLLRSKRLKLDFKYALRDIDKAKKEIMTEQRANLIFSKYPILKSKLDGSDIFISRDGKRIGIKEYALRNKLLNIYKNDGKWYLFGDKLSNSEYRDLLEATKYPNIWIDAETGELKYNERNGMARYIVKEHLSDILKGNNNSNTRASG